MTLKIAINGFGQIDCCASQALTEIDAKEAQIMDINSSVPVVRQTMASRVTSVDPFETVVFGAPDGPARDWMTLLMAARQEQKKWH